MAPESSTQTDDAIASSSTAAPTRPPPTQPPPNNAQTQTQTGFHLYPGSYVDASSAGGDQVLYESCKTQYGGLRPKIIAMTIFTCLVFIAHFILFVFACIDMSRRNRNNRAPVMVFAAPPYWGPAAQGFQQMPQNGGPPAQNQGQPIPMQNWAVPQMNEKGIAPMAPAQAPTDRYA
ncbi:hypothetical protein NW755_007632 [Fusarium falciforme]|uniref:Uncharacterized protein n=1 Tax=Fusarium falciforme TaxID=195108 RepID=A0A9W8R6R5_9HYPO|nr:hypothetical protein NW755_007632 [Fusarium falciforme]